MPQYASTTKENESTVQNEDALTVKREADSTNIAKPTLVETKSSTEDDEFSTTDFDDVDFSIAEDETIDGFVLTEGTVSSHLQNDETTKQLSNTLAPRTPAAHVQSLKPGPPNVTPKVLPPAMGPANVGSNKPMQTKPSNLQHQLPPPHMQKQQIAQNSPQNRNVVQNRVANQPTPQNMATPTARPVSNINPHSRSNQTSNSNNPENGTNQSGNTNGIKNSDGGLGQEETPMPANAPIGFFSARVAETIQAPPPVLPGDAVFNPHAESPSIRKTAGVDHTKSKPIARDPTSSQPAVQASGSNIPSVPRPNIVNPALDPNRKIGMPPSMASPMANRGNYKPPTMKRPLEGGNIYP
jgi:hypothetical protein